MSATWCLVVWLSGKPAAITPGFTSEHRCEVAGQKAYDDLHVWVLQPVRWYCVRVD